jgi:hypothetical protein
VKGKALIKQLEVEAQIRGLEDEIITRGFELGSKEELEIEARICELEVLLKALRREKPSVRKASGS